MQSSIFRFSDTQWLLFYIIVVLSWIGIFLMILEANRGTELETFYGSELLATLCKPVESYKDWPYSFLMWALMGVAMMVPTVYPTLETYDDLVYTGAAPKLGFFYILLGFIMIWLGFAILASLFQVFLTELRFLSSDGRFISPLASTVLLILAGLYQFSSLKKACLHRCRHPFTFFLNNWNGRPENIFFIGLRIGIFCLGCCWLLMLLAFVGGIMNIGFMAIATLVMIGEKLPKFGQYITLPLSVLLLISGSLVAISSFN
tara:strand:+ start:1244 stop:2023 length:780 start_codon:yes stop_codon:yes gene_type:complete